MYLLLVCTRHFSYLVTSCTMLVSHKQVFKHAYSSLSPVLKSTKKLLLWFSSLHFSRSWGNNAALHWCWPSFQGNVLPGFCALSHQKTCQGEERSHRLLQFSCAASGPGEHCYSVLGASFLPFHLPLEVGAEERQHSFLRGFVKEVYLG